MQWKLLAALVLSVCPVSAQAASFAGHDFTTNGSASVVGGDLQLTPPTGHQAGSAFISTPFAVMAGTSFIATFDFSLATGGLSAQADGIGFVVQNSPSGANALGDAGGTVGFAGSTAISPSIGALFRTWTFDIAHIAFNGDLGTGSTQAFNLNGDTVTGTATVTYNGLTDTFNLTATNSNLSAVNFSETFDLTTLGSQAYFGFTGGTGAAFSDQRITDFTLVGVAAIPEPSTYALMIVGLGVVGFVARRRRKAH